MELIISMYRQICHQRFAAKKTNVDKKPWQNVLPVNVLISVTLSLCYIYAVSNVIKYAVRFSLGFLFCISSTQYFFLKKLIRNYVVLP